MENYDLKDISNHQFTTFHDIIRISQERMSETPEHKPEDFLVINLTLNGEVVYQNDASDRKLLPNTITITHPGEPHQLILPQDNELCTLIYSPNYVQHFLSAINKTHAFLLDNPENPFKEKFEFHRAILEGKWDTVEYIKKVYELMEHIEINDLRLLQESYFHDALLSLIREEYYARTVAKLQEKATPGIKEETMQRIQLALDYINDCYHENISIDTLSAISNMSKFHFTRMFKQITGKTPYQYLIHKRIEKAKVLLIHSKLSITEIALEVGFNNTSSFYNVFQKETGMSPKYIRKG